MKEHEKLVFPLFVSTTENLGLILCIFQLFLWGHVCITALHIHVFIPHRNSFHKLHLV